MPESEVRRLKITVSSRNRFSISASMSMRCRISTITCFITSYFSSMPPHYIPLLANGKEGGRDPIERKAGRQALRDDHCDDRHHINELEIHHARGLVFR